MVGRVGFPLYDLLVDMVDLNQDILGLIPDSIETFLRQFTASHLQSTQSANAVFHTGKIYLLTDEINPIGFDVGIGRLQIPLLNTGVPFTLSYLRDFGAGNLEAAPDGWQLDLNLNQLILTFYNLSPAKYVAEAGVMTRHLVPDTSKDLVQATGSAVLRLSQRPGEAVIVSFVDQADPFDPEVSTGGVGRLTFSPPHFFLGKSDFGMTVRDFVYDGSDTYSPPDVQAHNQGPDWVGLLIREATVYAPRNTPVVKSFSGGVKDVLLGSPGGIQGELEIQFGRSPLTPSTLNFQHDGQTLVAEETTQSEQLIRLPAGTDIDDVVDIVVNLQSGSPGPSDSFGATNDPGSSATQTNWEFEWTWNQDEPVIGDTSRRGVKAGDVLSVRPIEIVRDTVTQTEEKFYRNPLLFTFMRTPPLERLSVTDTGSGLTDIIHLSGTYDDLQALVLEANLVDGVDHMARWWVMGMPPVEHGHIYQPILTGLLGKLDGRQILRVTETTRRAKVKDTLHIAIDIVPEGPLLIGTPLGVFNPAISTSDPLPITRVFADWRLSDFLDKGALEQLDDSSSLTPTMPPHVDVPSDGLAEVVLSTAPAPDLVYERHISLLMEFGQDNVLTWGREPQSGQPSVNDDSFHRQVQAWAAQFPGADFIVIGRCDDIQTNDSSETPNFFNIQLAKERAQRGHEFLTTAAPSGGANAAGPIDPSRVWYRGEFEDWHRDASAGDALEIDAEVGLTPAEQSAATAGAYQGWLIKHEHGFGIGNPAEEPFRDWVNQRDDAGMVPAYESIRKQYRRIDIYAVGGTPNDSAEVPQTVEWQASDTRISFIPSTNRAVSLRRSPTPALAYRLKLLVRWDSPGSARLSDAIPSKAEIEFVWSANRDGAPTIPGGDTTNLGGGEYVIFLKWVHDPRTDYTRAALGVRRNDAGEGLFTIDEKWLVAALTVAPMVLPGMDANDLTDAGVRLGLLAAASATAGSWMGNDSETDIVGIEAEWEARSLRKPGDDQQIRLLVEYVSTINVSFQSGLLDVETVPNRPMKLRVKRVGVEMSFEEVSGEPETQFGLVFDKSDVEVEDPGKWTISGKIGDFLRIADIAMGQGSMWVEIRVAAALDVGLVEITEAVMRFTYDDSGLHFELRGFEISTDIPGTLKGQGRLRLGEGGMVRAGVDATLIPIGLGVNAALAFAKPPEIAPSVFLTLGLGVTFSTPLPLGPTGAAIYGFNGLFVMNGERDMPGTPDPVARELEWWGTPAEQKYKPRKGQYAIGVGVAVGTMPDASFCFSASGMVVVGFPDLEIILGVDVSIISVPDVEVRESRGSESTITGLISITRDAVIVAVSATYKIPDILDVRIPFGAYFPSGNATQTYVRLGSDGVTAVRADGLSVTRYGESVTATLFPGKLDFTAWSYLMIEEGGLPSLGGDPRFTFDGFSVGFGAGFAVNWASGPIKLNASAKVLVGFGTDPVLIMGGIFVAGELDLKVVSIAARGELILTYQNGNLTLEGEFCASVKVFFVRIKGCVGIKLGDPALPAPPPPEPPVTDVSLTDITGRIMGFAALPTINPIPGAPIFDMTDPDVDPDPATLPRYGTNSGTSARGNATVWPDTAPTIAFRHGVTLAPSMSGNFGISAPPTQPLWFGGNRLKYAYQIKSVHLRDAAGNDVAGSGSDLASAWVNSPHRQPNSSGVNNPLPSEHEGPRLRLLDSTPGSWIADMDNGGQDVPGDPARTIEEGCDPLPNPNPACLKGGDAAIDAGPVSQFFQATPAPGPYPSRFSVIGQPMLRAGSSKISGSALIAFLNQSDVSIVPGTHRTVQPAIAHDGLSLDRGYVLPGGLHTSPSLRRTALPWEAQFDRRVVAARATIMLCEGLNGSPESGGKVCFGFETVKPSGTKLSILGDGLRLDAVQSVHRIELTDKVDFDPTGSQPGGDKVAEAQISKSGLDIVFDVPHKSVDLSFMLFGKPSLRVSAFDAAGAALPVRMVTGPVERTVKTKLRAAAGIARIRVDQGEDLAVLFRICRENPLTTEPGKDEFHCEDFEDIKPSKKGQKTLKVGSHVVETIAVANPKTLLQRIDRLDLRGSVPVAGRDGRTEILVPEDGVNIKLGHVCREATLHVWQFGDAPIIARGLDANGKVVARALSRKGQKGAVILRLSDVARPMHTIHVSGGESKSLLYSVCCREADSGQIIKETCVDFADLSSKPLSRSDISHDGLLIHTFDRRSPLRLGDVIDSGAGAAGEDRKNDLIFTQAGIKISLPTACRAVTVSVLVRGGPIIVRAKNKLGATVASLNSGPADKRVQSLVLQGEDIHSIEMGGGTTASALSQLCYNPVQSDPKAGGSTEPSDQGVSDSKLLVRGVFGDALVDEWEIKTLSQSGTCRVLELIAPDPRAALDGFHITSPSGQDVTLLSVCGIDEAAMLARDADEAARLDGLQDNSDMANTPVEARRDIVLDPDATYSVAVAWNYAVWQSNSDGTNSPPTTPSGWTPGGTVVRRFHTAAQTAEPSATPDGLNEYIFDAKDIIRHIRRVEPDDGRAVHFTDDPLWIDFAAPYVEELLGRYGLQLRLDVLRTDAPPEPGGRSGPVIAPQMGAHIWAASPLGLEPLGVQRVNTAAIEAPCLPDAPITGGGSIAARFDLDPLAMYDFNIEAVSADPATDPVRIHGTRFTTSRYADPDAMMHHLGFPPAAINSTMAEEIFMNGGVMPPNADVIISDLAMSDFLREIGADTLPLPTRKPQTHLIWQQSGSDFNLVGVLLDSLEPLRRRSAFQVADGLGGITEIGDRCIPDRMEIGATQFSPRLATERWARVLFVPDTSPVLNSAAPNILELHLQTSSGPLSGNRLVPARPTILEREGL